MVAHCFIVKTNMLTRTIPVGSLKMAQEFCNTFQNLQVKKIFNGMFFFNFFYFIYLF